MTDVRGTERMDSPGGLGEMPKVSSCSYDPGYDIKKSLLWATTADLKRGYCDYGAGIGDRENLRSK